MVGAISTIEGRRRTAERLCLRPSSRATFDDLHATGYMFESASTHYHCRGSRVRCALLEIKVVLGGENG
jgi:hypothetical protein